MKGSLSVSGQTPGRRSPTRPRWRALSVLGLFVIAVAAGAYYTDYLRPLPDPTRAVSGWQWWFTPREQNAFMRMPVITGPLQGMDVSRDGRVIVLVGADDFMLTSPDAGRTWIRGEIRSEAALAKPATGAFNWHWSLTGLAHADVRPDPERRENKAAPAAEQSKPKQPDVQPAAAATNKRGAPRAGKQPASAKSSPAPEAQPTSILDIPAARHKLLDVKVIDDQTYVAVGGNGLIVRTTDGGRTWSIRSSTTSEALNAIACSDADCVVVGDRGAVLRSDNKGETWRFALQLSVRMTAIERVNSARWIAVDDKGEVFSFDRNLGLTRTMQLPVDTVEPIAESFDLAFDPSGRLGLVARARGKVWLTTDSGDTWSPVAGPPNAIPFSVALDAMGSAFIAGDRSPTSLTPLRPDLVAPVGFTVAVTRDRAKTWQDERPRGRTSLLGWSSRTRIVASDEYVFMLASDNTLLRRSAQGEWTRLSFGAYDFRSLAMQVATPAGLIVGAQGLVLASLDRGVTWEPRASGTDAELNSVTFANSQQVTAVGDHVALTSRDAGNTWARTKDPVGAVAKARIPGSLRIDLNTANVPLDAWERAFNGDGVGLAINRMGDDLIRTTDRGAHWSEVANPTGTPLESISFSGNDRVVVLAQGRVALSDDAGASFRLVEYHRYPSPWLWLSSLLLVGGVLMYARSNLNDPEIDLAPPSIADSAASDRPIQWWDPDHAGLRDIALGLSRFLRNRKTDPPLTVAITGEWGTGKSSLMNLLRHDLERYGYRPVWFNAWHHQSGENLLGSLLANVHAQGIPSFLSIAGFDFRCSLTLIRARRFWLQLGSILLLLAVVGFSYSVLKDKWFTFWTTLTQTSDNKATSIGAATGLIGIALSIVTPFLAVIRGVSAFGLQPSKLIAAVATTRSDESARHQAGARYRFAQEFEDFTRALEPRPLVIFIDDLDRCRAANVVEALEAVNFLVSSGRCIVVLGMAKHWVETCVGLAFKELANAQIEPGDVAEVGAESREQQVFARQYLEKLINIEIRVPQLSDAAASAILQGSEPAQTYRSLRFALGTVLLRSFRWLALAAALCAVGALGYWIAQSLALLTAPVVSDTRASTQPESEATQPASATTVANATPERTENNSEQPASLEPSRAHVSTGFYWCGATLVAIAVVILILLASFARREAQTEDSPAFRDALRILQPFILLGGGSPRSLKRFVNHVRYLAMRVRPEPNTPTGVERLTDRIRRFFGRSSWQASTLTTTPLEGLSEELLVAFTAFQRCGDDWLDCLFLGAERNPLPVVINRDLAKRFNLFAEREAVLKRLLSAADDFNQRFTGSALFADATWDLQRAQTFATLTSPKASGHRASSANTPSQPTAAVPSHPPSEQIY